MKQVYKTIAYSLNAIILLLLLNTGLFAQTYCEPNSTGSGYTNCTYNGGITKFEFAGISNTTSSCDNSGTVAYTYFSTVAAASAILGSTYTVSVTMYDPSAGSTAAIWIDYDQDGVFSSGEFLLLGTVTTATSTHTFTNNITIPATATTGTSRIRIRTKRGGTLTATNACGVSGSDRGEIEDYKIDLISNVTCTGTPAPGNTLSTTVNVCSSTDFTLSLQNTTEGGGVTYQWQSSKDNNVWNNISGATSKSLLTSQIASNYYRCQVTCSGNTGTSNPVQVVTTPATLPLVEFFASATIPSCWKSSIIAGSYNVTFVSTSSTPSATPFGGSGYMAYYDSYLASANNSARLITKPFSTESISSVDLTFQWYHTNSSSAYNDRMQVQYSLDGVTWTDVSGALFTRYNATAGWTKKTVTLPNVTANQAAVLIAFQFITGGLLGERMLLDEVNIKKSPTCLPPGALIANTVLANAATISYTAPAVAPASGYEYYLSTSSAAPTDLTIATGTSNNTDINLSALTASTTYYISVRSNCGSEKSEWSTALTFKTPCAVVTLPFTESFTSATIPSCWTAAAISGTYSVTLVASSSSPTATPYGGSGYMAYYDSYNSSSNNSARLATKPFSTTSNSSVDLVFQWYHTITSTSNNDRMQVQYSFDGSTWTDVNGALFTRVGTTTGWSKKTVTLPAAVSNKAQVFIGFVFTSGYGERMLLDEINIKPSPTCIPPVNITVGNLLSNSATITYTAPNIVPGNGYEYYLSTLATAPNSGTTATNTSGNLNINLEGLNAATQYYIWLRSNCGSEKSEWSDAVTFTTACSISTLPFTESFSGTAIPACWTNIAGTGTISHISVLTSGSSPTATPYGGSGSMVRYNSYSINNGLYSILSTKPFSTVGLENISLKFQWYHSNLTATSTDRVEIVYSFDNTVWTSSAVSINRYFSTSGWQEKIVSLPAEVNNKNVVYMGFKFISNNGYNMYLDEVNLSGTLACTAPTNLTSSTITHNEATASWTAPASTPSDGYQYYLSTSATAPTAAATATGTVNSTTVILESLAAETTYYFWVRSNCGTANSAWSSMATFTTTAVPITNVSNIVFNGIDCNSAKISWTKPADFNANFKVLVYLKSGSAIASGVSSLNAGDIYTDTYFEDGDSYDADVNAYAVYYGNGNEVTVNGLQSGQVYYALVYVVENDTKYSSGSSSGANSVSIPANIAKYRTVSNGNFNSLSVWQYNSCGTTWVTATQLPGSANDVEIYHNISLQQNISLHDINLENVGKFDLGNYNLTVTGNINGYSSANYFVTSGAGKLIRSVDAAVSTSDVIFPVGNTSVFAPVKLVPVQYANSFAVKYGDVTSYASTESEWKNIATTSWDITKLNANVTQVRVGLSAPTPSLTWRSIVAEGTSVAPVSTDALVIMHFDQDGWEVAGDNYNGTLTGGGDHPEYIAYGISGATSNGRFIFSQPVSIFSPFTLGVASTSVVLPVNFVYANVKTENNSNILNWEIATNEPVKNFEIEVSVDNGLTFKTVAEITVNDGKIFRFTDNATYNNVNLFYRIKANTVAGTSYYSSILKIVVNNNIAAKITVVPNPVTGSQFKLNASNLKTGIYQLSILSVDGKVAYTKSIKIYESGNTVLPVQLSNKLNAGIYILKVENTTEKYIYKIAFE